MRGYQLVAIPSPSCVTQLTNFSFPNSRMDGRKYTTKDEGVEMLVQEAREVEAGRCVKGKQKDRRYKRVPDKGTLRREDEYTTSRDSLFDIALEEKETEWKGGNTQSRENC